MFTLYFIYVCGVLATAWTMINIPKPTESEPYRNIAEVLASLLWPIFWVHVIIVAVMKHAK